LRFILRIGALNELPVADMRAVIINCSTKVVTTLALMSALERGNAPVLLIDCESTDGSWEWFSHLAQTYSFDLIKAPLRKHGDTLDWLFANLRDEHVLLIDSDLEILDINIVAQMRAAIQSAHCYGAGFLHGESIFPLGVHTRIDAGRHMARMWIPFTLLKTKAVQEKLATGVSFLQYREYLDIPWSAFASRLAFVRHRFPFANRVSTKLFEGARQRIRGETCSYREYDTGARLHESLTKSGWNFADLGATRWAESSHHYHGITRAKLKLSVEDINAIEVAEQEVKEKVKKKYGLDL
jgi:glycosyltransferase involved in cell wall biosynthesis